MPLLNQLYRALAAGHSEDYLAMAATSLVSEAGTQHATCENDRRLLASNEVQLTSSSGKGG
jgi:hypothetical protein